jgi:hypothetical protein
MMPSVRRVVPAVEREGEQAVAAADEDSAV